MHRNDGGIVDAELLRPRWWIAQHNIVAGKLLPMNIEELQVHGSAIVTSIDECPEIAGGEGSVVTATFKTREVNTVVHAEIIGPDGTIELIEGTPIHPIWSVDRNDWVPLGELTEGETLHASGGIATVLSLAPVTCSLPVYNIEVHGEHVYQVGELGLLVHNTYPTDPIRGLTGQIHHPISTKVGRAIDNHPILKGVFQKRDPRFVTQAVNEAAHRGYQRWHRELDNEVVEWIRKNPTKNADDFLAYLRELYKRPDLAERFPDGF
jgi:hypothetical protein